MADERSANGLRYFSFNGAKLWNSLSSEAKRVLSQNYVVKDTNHYSLLCDTYFFLSELCWGKAMVAYTMPQQRKKEKSERLRGGRDETQTDVILSTV